MEKTTIKCKFCKGTNCYKKGYRQTEYRGKIQKYYCKDCKRLFTQDLGFYRMRYSGTNETPFERAGVDIVLGDNRWLDLIKLATINN